MQVDHGLITLSIVLVIASAVYKGFAALTTKLTASANRSVAEQAIIPVVWTFFLLYTEEGHESFKWWKLLCYGLIVLSVLFFNKILCFGPNDRIMIMPQQSSQQ